MNQEKKHGGMMGGIEDLYREVILEHFKSAKNKGRLSPANAESEGYNPLCGDQIIVTAMVQEGRIKDIKFEGHGCAISQAAASIMADLVKGKTIDEVKDLTKTIKKFLGVETEADSSAAFEVDDLDDAVALEGVKKYPVRIKCALLSWNTLAQSLDSKEKKV